MLYKIKKLPSFDKSVFDADGTLYALNPKAADKYYEDYVSKIDLLKKHPNMYQVFDDDPYFRATPLVYGYRLFYHVDERSKSVILHRVIHGAIDLAKQLQMAD